MFTHSTAVLSFMFVFSLITYTRRYCNEACLLVGLFVTPSPIHRGTGYCFRSISLYLCLYVYIFLCFFVSKITGKRLDRFARYFQGRCGVTMGRPDPILGQIGETARCCDANFFYIICQHYEQTAGPICTKFSGKVWSDICTWPDYIFGQFRETAWCCDAQHRDGVCCAFTPQLVCYFVCTFIFWACCDFS